jgi:hypothetical protein
MYANLRRMLLATTMMMCGGPSAFANVITDWDEKAVAVVAPMPPLPAQRVMAMVHTAMFDAVNRAALPTISGAAGCSPEHVEGSRCRGSRRYDTGVN